MKKIFLPIIIFIILASVLVSFTLAGCKNTTTTTAAAETTVAGAETTAAGAETAKPNVSEPVTITLWHMDWTPFTEGFANVVSGFKEKNPNITVQLEPQPGQTELVTKMRSALVSGKGASMFATPGTTILEWAIAGNLQPVTPGVFTVDWAKENLLPENLSHCNLNDQLWAVGIPDGPGDWAVIANTDHLKEAGLPVIDKFESMAQLLEYAKKLSKYDASGKLVRAGLSFQESNDPIYFLSYVVDNGGKFWDNDNQKFTLNTPEAKEVLQFFYDIFYKEKFDSVELPDSATGLLQGLDSMAFMWSEFKPYAEGATPGLNLTTILKPAFKGTQSPKFSHTDTWDVVVPKYVTGLEKDATFEFLRYLISEEGQMKFLEKYPAISPLKKLTLENDFYTTGPGAYNKPMIDAIKAGGSLSHWGPYASLDVIVYNIIWPNLDALIHQQISVDECLVKMDKELNEQIEKDKQKYPDMPKTIIEWNGLSAIK